MVMEEFVHLFIYHFYIEYIELLFWSKSGNNLLHLIKDFVDF